MPVADANVVTYLKQIRVVLNNGRWTGCLHGSSLLLAAQFHPMSCVYISYVHVHPLH